MISLIQWRLLAAVVFSVVLSCWSGAAFAASGGMQLEGVNISGAEWGSRIPGTYMIDYVFPTNAEMDYFAAKGMKVIRVPIMWERLQPQANGTFDSNYLGLLDSVISYASNTKGMRVIIDLHNYGAYYNVTLGVPGGQPNSIFANFWTQIASRYKGNSKVVFGLMNEPVGFTMTATTWLATAQEAINAIRATGSTNLILVPSTYWGHPVNFVELNASVMINVRDPANNFSYDVHQYLDYDGSGTHTDTISVAEAVATLSEFTAWLKANNRTAFLSEIGVPATTGGLDDLDAMLKYMHANAAQWDGYTYWSAGPWWQGYVFGVEPVNGQDTPQMTVLINNLGTSTSGGGTTDGSSDGTTSGGTSDGTTGGTTDGSGGTTSSPGKKKGKKFKTN